MSDTKQIEIGETMDGSTVQVPVVEMLTGRGFVTGKSGSGKSNTASVLAEELLESGFPLLIVDTDGEYYGLKEEYELLHAGADEECDIQITPEHAERMAHIALEENVPIILDVSGYLDESVANELILETTKHLFAKEKKLKKPFLLVVEEVHEYIPEGGGMDETGKMLIKVGKRGRKHGLGVVGVSQRPADVKKDFITQANWLVWHRLTWENDTKVVGRILGSEYENRITDMNAGQAFMMADWAEADIRTIQFRRKRTFDAGATPGLDDFERPELKSVSDTLVEDLSDISEEKAERENRIIELENEIAKKDKRIETLEDELDRAKDISAAAKQMADALAGNTGIEAPTEQSKLPTAEDEDGKPDEEKSNAEIEVERNEFRRRVRELEGEVERLEARNEQLREDAEKLRESSGDTDIIEDQRDRISFLEMALEQLQRRFSEPARSSTSSTDGDDESALSLVNLVHTDPVEERVEEAIREAECNERYTWDTIAVLSEKAPMTVAAVEQVVDTDAERIQSALTELRKQSVVARDESGRYDLDRAAMERIIGKKRERERLTAVKDQARRE
ncbi:helicase HerA domain-containing protein [Haloarchaeobius sp. DFWS5]|uniref:ATP-binding protein n=1 Tax=Haloarchaeobius sp. DFWS5 TaxID=3446114 RepID=UPI003EBEB84B